MGITLVTGATGFLGSHIARALADRGDSLRLTVRPTSDATRLAELGAQVVTCDMLDRRAVRRAMRGVDARVPCRGLDVTARPRETLFRVNAEGTRIVLEEALAGRGRARRPHLARSPRSARRSRGSTADETQVFRAGALRASPT